MYHCEIMEDSVTTYVDIDNASPILNIISHHSLTMEHLQKECSQKVQLQISKELKDWEMLGRYLKLSEQDLTAIKRDNHTEEQRKVDMLDTWHKREGSNATYLKVANALYHHGRRDLVELLCHIVKPASTPAVTLARTVPVNKSEVMFRSNLEDIQSRFAVLLQNVQSALKANHIASVDVHGVLIGMFSSGDCLPKTNLEEMFTAATSQRLWDYIHHSPVEKLLRRFIPDHLSLMREYKAHLSGFYTTAKLIDYITCMNIDSIVEGELDLEKLTVANYQKLKVKLELDRKIDTLSLKYVQDLWEEFAEEFDIPYLTAIIGKILSGSLHITWLITPDVANKIVTAARRSSFFQTHPNIIYIAIDNTILYDEVRFIRRNHISSNVAINLMLGHSNKMICFWSPARMYFRKFPKNIIINAIAVPCISYTEAHQR